ncbi:acyl-CoA synthase [Blastococcus sp. CT_GayMR16]|uniref:acyl-CoA synthase n=1 Tax=Blastococcus sp. CT_GayMR16 TaxID=2559607 RepID=UPI0010740836|nr:acyl-CoA synthase [Blastococcus sp. CT_GayMR16]TFV88813.1 acyl-CoA synthase [Blastococcus sp. CT_GayMR16]
MTEPGDGGLLERPADEDHDLLTYGEAGVRLQTEIQTLRDEVARLAAATDPGPALGSARARLALLEDAAQRNARQPITDDNFEAFFGYRGTARRNTT